MSDPDNLDYEYVAIVEELEERSDLEEVDNFDYVDYVEEDDENYQSAATTSNSKSATEYSRAFEEYLQDNVGNEDDEEIYQEHLIEEVEEDVGDVVADDNTGEAFHCSSCNVKFYNSVQEHIDEYHQDQSVVVDTNIKQELSDVPDNTSSDENEFLELYEEVSQDLENMKENCDNEDDIVDEEEPTPFFCCNKCEKRYITSEELINHITSTHVSGKIMKQIKEDAELDKTYIEAEIVDEDDTKPYTCNLCPASFLFCRQLTLHMKSEHKAANKNPLPRTCKVCSITLPSAKGLKEHMLEHCNTNAEYEFQEKISMLPDSMATSTEDLPFICIKCPAKFPKLKELTRHYAFDHSNELKRSKHPTKERAGLKVCKICNTHNLKNLTLHMRIHNPVLKVKTVEEVMAASKSDLKEGPKIFCEHCNKSFHKSLIKAHMNSHINPTEFTCKLCNKDFESEQHLIMHMKCHEKPNKKTKAEIAGVKLPHACQYCGREFLRPHEKVKHERIHTGEKPYECEVCGKRFRVSYSLTLHLRTHTTLRPYVCSVCHKRYKSYAVYSIHIQTHSEERPYQCPHCPKSFKTPNQFIGHKNSHTKPYNCPECNRPFSSLFAVKKHMKTHNKANKSNSNLKHSCVVCGAVYARLFALRYHMKDQHEVDMDEDIELAAIAEESENTYMQVSEQDDSVYMNEDEISTQAILQEEIVLDGNFQTEEVVTDWLIK